MFRLFIDGLVAFGLLGITEVIIKPLATRVVQSPVEKLMQRSKPFLKKIYTYFDYLVPGILESGEDPVNRMAWVIESVVGLNQEEALLLAQELLKPSRVEGYSLKANVDTLSEQTLFDLTDENNVID